MSDSEWGAFDSPLLAELRQRLDAADYAKTRHLPAWPTRMVFPFHDLEHWWHPTDLGSCSHPSRFHQRFARRHPEAFRLYRLLFLHHEVPERDLPGLIEAHRARVQVAAVGPTYILSSIPHRSPGEFVYLGDDSALLIRAARGLRGARALDLACGCGVIGLNLPPSYREVDGLDLNPTAIRLAGSNLRLNPREGVRFAVSDLYAEARGTYDLIIGNPPALPLPEGDPDLGFARGGANPAALTLRAVEGLPQHLASGGTALFSTFSLAGRLGEQLDLPRDFSLHFHIRERIRLTDPQHPFIDHVVLRIVRDGRGQRRRTGPTWWERLKRWGWPGAEDFPQAERLHPSGRRTAPPSPPPAV